jgi:hypothetical protein
MDLNKIDRHDNGEKEYENDRSNDPHDVQVSILFSWMVTWAVPILFNFNWVEIGAVQTSLLERKSKVWTAMITFILKLMKIMTS